MPSCVIRGVRSVELATTNMEEAARFYETVWMLEPVEIRNASCYFRGTVGYHHLLGLHVGPQPAVVRIVFDVADRKSLDALHKAIAAAGGKPGAPGPVTIGGGGYGFGCKDPDGRNLAFVCEAAVHADSADKPDRPRKIVHVNAQCAGFRREPEILHRRARLSHRR